MSNPLTYAGALRRAAADFTLEYAKQCEELDAHKSFPLDIVDRHGNTTYRFETEEDVLAKVNEADFTDMDEIYKWFRTYVDPDESDIDFDDWYTEIEENADKIVSDSHGLGDSGEALRL